MVFSAGDVLDDNDVLDLCDVVDECDVVDARPAVDEWATLEQLLEFEPGPMVITFLNAIEISELDGDAQLVVMQLWERQLAWMSERAASVTAAAAGPTPPVATPDDDWNIDMIAATLGLANGGAGARVAIARALTEDLPLCRAAMAAGDLSQRHAWVMVEAISDLDAAARGWSTRGSRGKSVAKAGRRFGGRCGPRSSRRT